MTVRVYKVRLQSNNRLDVIDGGKPIDVDNGSETTIIWYLDFTGAPRGVTGGYFNAIDTTDTSGFRWPTAPDPGNFGTAARVGGMNQAVAIDDMAITTTATDFIYQLNATITTANGQSNYQTGITGPKRTMSDPLIRNS